MMKKKEYIIISIILVILLGIVAFNYFNKTNTNKVVIRDGYGDIVDTLDLNEDGYYEYTGNYGLFHLEIKDGKVRAIDVDCPNQICVNTGWIDSENLNQIICVPNALWVEIE